MGALKGHLVARENAGVSSIKSAALGKKLCKDAHFFCNFLQDFTNRCVFSAIFCKFVQFFTPPCAFD